MNSVTTNKQTKTITAYIPVNILSSLLLHHGTFDNCFAHVYAFGQLSYFSLFSV